jgi:hypothetical protein
MMVTYGSFNRLEARGMADFRVNDQLAVRASGIFKGRDGYVDLLDYGVAHPSENVPANNARGAFPVVGTQGGQAIGAGRLALRWEPSSTVEVNLTATTRASARNRNPRSFSPRAGRRARAIRCSFQRRRRRCQRRPRERPRSRPARMATGQERRRDPVRLPLRAGRPV